MKRHFVTFLSPGTFVSEHTEKPISSWDTSKAVKMSKSITERHGARPYGFFFSTRSRSIKDLDSKVSKQSNMYYLGGKILTLEQVKKTMPDDDILIINMEMNEFKEVIVNTNSWKAVLPFNKGDVLLKV